MVTTADDILQALKAVAAERALRASDPSLAAQTSAVKAFQHARFSSTYADLLQHPRFAAAARFFLDDLYGPGDFTQRDAQFARVVPALVRLFPKEIVSTVGSLARLHALSERLDTAMARASIGTLLDGQRYGDAWRAVGEADAREQQIVLMVSVGAALDNYTRNRLLRQTLRLMRGPANAAGLAALQQFLERGFDTFRDMKGAGEFLDTIAQRERSLATALFDGASV